MTPEDEQHIRSLIKASVKAGTKEAVLETLQHFGVDTEDPLSMQKDFAMMRGLREGSKRAQLAAIGGAITLLLGLIGILLVNGASDALRALLGHGGDK